MNLFIKNSICFLLVLLVCINRSMSQVAPYSKVNIVSPTAASLGKFGDIPVNNHTGIPSISIPIYTVKEGPLSLPISLSYHAGGIKTMEPSGWVGAGWVIGNAGGVISRTVRGAPDEATNSNAERGHFRNYGFSNYLTLDGGGRCPAGGAGVQNNDHFFAMDFFDGEPDLFSFNFAGYSGKFFFNDDRVPVLVEAQDIKIDYFYEENPVPAIATSGNIQGFKLTVSNGDKYFFGVIPGRILPVSNLLKRVSH